MAKFVHKAPPVDTPEYLAAWLARIAANSVVTETGCKLWQGHVNGKGYGMTTYHSKTVAIHRKILELKLGIKLSTVQFSCHACDERRCWNEDHLFLGDAKANNNDCAGKGRHHNAVKTHCKYGHEFTPENTTYYDTGTGSIARKCLTCHEIRGKSPERLQYARDYQKRLREQRKREKEVNTHE